MRIGACREDYLPTWVRSDVLEQLWSPENFLYVSFWEGAPRKTWFRRETVESNLFFATADIEIIEKEVGQFAIEFVNGRHRTRWLLGLGYENIPVGLTERGFSIAKKARLATQRVKHGEQFSF